VRPAFIVRPEFHFPPMGKKKRPAESGKKRGSSAGVISHVPGSRPFQEEGYVGYLGRRKRGGTGGNKADSRKEVKGKRMTRPRRKGGGGKREANSRTSTLCPN